MGQGEKNWNESFRPSLRETEIYNPHRKEVKDEQTQRRY